MVTVNAAPRWDDDTAVQYSYKWNRILLSQLPNDHEHVDLHEDLCTRKTVETTLKEQRPELFIFYDHGSNKGLVGQGGKEYIIDTSNVKLLSGVEVYTMCCSAASVLGQKAFREGCKAWWGYVRPFSFVLEDEEIFMKLANKGMLLRHQGLSWSKCYELVYDAYTDKIEKLKDTDTSPWTIVSLVNNRNALTVWHRDNPPPSDCPVRNVAIDLFGVPGHKLEKSYSIALSLNVLILILQLYMNNICLDPGWRIPGVTMWLGLLGSQWLMFRKHLEALKH